MGQRICLNMIVKNEAHVIERCLRSVRPFIHSWAISDTGSADGTQDIIRKQLGDLPGELIERPWVDFAHNRNEALQLARRYGDYVLLMDADDVLERDAGFVLPDLGARAYSIEFAFGETRYFRNFIVRLDDTVRWHGVLHEVIDAPGGIVATPLRGLRMRISKGEGARSKVPTAEKYSADAEVLRRALQDEPGNTRYAFYLAQSLRDAGRPAEARVAYQRRIEMGGWDEEVYYSRLQLAALLEQERAPEGEIVTAYLAAYQFRPTRAEPLTALARYHRESQRYAAALLFARTAALLPRPSDILFVDASVYEWRARDELAVAAYWCGELELSARLCRELLADARLPANQHERVRGNLAFAELGQGGKESPVDAGAVSAKPVVESNETKAAFSEIYRSNVWGSGSGPGSDPVAAKAYLEFLRDFLAKHDIRSVLDCGCGDWQLMREVDLTGIDYLGIDVVDSVVEANRAQFGRDGVRFLCQDFVETDLPAADLLLCKDVLQHLPNSKVWRFLAKLKGYGYALITNDVRDNSDRDAELRLSPYRYALLDLTQAPFGLPAEAVCSLLGNKVSLLVHGSDIGDRYDRPWSPTSHSQFADASAAPTVLLAVLAKQKASVLPLYLRCLEALDYPKSRIVLYVRTNNNTDSTESILRAWVDRVGSQYAAVEFDASDVVDRVQDFDVHEWNPLRFRVLGKIRQASIQRAKALACDFYFVADCDNFLKPNTLSSLVRLNLPLVAPLVRHSDASQRYANFHFKVDENGYYKECEEYDWVNQQRVRGVLAVDVVHCTYLIRRDAFDRVTYGDGSDRHEYVVFSDSARRAGLIQYLDNREIYGYLSLDESWREAERLLTGVLPT